MRATLMFYFLVLINHIFFLHPPYPVVGLNARLSYSGMGIICHSSLNPQYFTHSRSKVFVEGRKEAMNE